MAIFNPFSTDERQNFPRFSPMFKSSPSNIETMPFRWSIDQLARLKPTSIDTDDSSLIASNKQSPDDEAHRQKEIDWFFSQAVLPSPWTASLPVQSSSATGHPKQVSFSLTDPPTASIQQDCLVLSQKQDGRTVEAGTQTNLTFPTILNGPWNAEEDEQEGNGGADESKHLRRKLFGKPERQNTTEEESLENDVTTSNAAPSHLPLLTSLTTPTYNPSDKNDTHTVLHRDQPFFQTSSQTPHDRHPPFTISPHAHTNDMSMDSFHSSLELAPFHSSMVLTPGGKLPGLSPIGELVESPEVFLSSTGICEDQNVEPIILQMSSIHCSSEVDVTREEEEDKVDLISSPTKSSANVNMKFTSTPNIPVTKRELAPPFACPVLKQLCTSDARHSHDDNNCPPACHQPGTCGSKKSSIRNSSDTLATPLHLADLCNQAPDLTNVTLTTCSKYLDTLALEDKERDSNTESTSQRTHPPLHSTADNLCSIYFPNRKPAQVCSHSNSAMHFLNRNQNSHIGGNKNEKNGKFMISRIPIIGTRVYPRHTSSTDSGVCGGSTFMEGVSLTPLYGSTNLSSCNHGGAHVGQPVFTSTSYPNPNDAGPSAIATATVKNELESSPQTFTTMELRAPDHGDRLKGSAVLATTRGRATTMPSPQKANEKMNSLTYISLGNDSGCVVNPTNQSTPTAVRSTAHHYKYNRDIPSPVNENDIKPNSSHNHTPSWSMSSCELLNQQKSSFASPSGHHHFMEYSNPIKKYTYPSNDVRSRAVIPFGPCSWTLVPSSFHRQYHSLPVVVGGAPDSTHNTPKRQVSRLSPMEDVGLRKVVAPGLVSSSSVLRNDLIRRKEMLKYRLQYRSPVRTHSPISDLANTTSTHSSHSLGWMRCGVRARMTAPHLLGNGSFPLHPWHSTCSPQVYGNKRELFCPSSHRRVKARLHHY